MFFWFAEALEADRSHPFNTDAISAIAIRGRPNL
jgi:hypothetical protein